MTWEVKWGHKKTTGTHAMARDLASPQRRSHRWHLVATGFLRARGVNTPVYRKDSWEIDWSKRKGKMVWARNPESKMPSARAWHWIKRNTLTKVGMKWKPYQRGSGRHIDKKGYVFLTPRGMTEEEISLADMHNLWLGAKKRRWVREHAIVACKKYGGIPPNTVVRHRNGIKSDNRPDNLLLGTTQENTMDHDQARLAAMFWREYAFVVLHQTMCILATREWK